MRSERNLTKTEQFTAVFERGGSLAERLIVVKHLRNGLPVTRFGFSVSSRVGGAVVRNQVKRRLREILRKAPLESGWDIVVIARTAAAQADFDSLNRSVQRLLIKARIWQAGT